MDGLELMLMQSRELLGQYTETSARNWFELAMDCREEFNITKGMVLASFQKALGRGTYPRHTVLAAIERVEAVRPPPVLNALLKAAGDVGYMPHPAPADAQPLLSYAAGGTYAPPTDAVIAATTPQVRVALGFVGPSTVSTVAVTPASAQAAGISDSGHSGTSTASATATPAQHVGFHFTGLSSVATVSVTPTSTPVLSPAFSVVSSTHGDSDIDDLDLELDGPIITFTTPVTPANMNIRFDFGGDDEDEDEYDMVGEYGDTYLGGVQILDNGTASLLVY